MDDGTWGGRAGVRVYRTVAHLEAIKGDWDALMGFAQGASATSGYAWCMAGWKLLQDAPGHGLAVVAIHYADGTLAGLWPLYVRPGSIGTEALQLGNGTGHEYGGPLVRDDQNAEITAQALVEAASQLADLLLVKVVRVGTAGHRAISEGPGPRIARPADSPVLRLRGKAWDAWISGKSRNLGRELRKGRARLAKSGRVDARMLDGPATVEACRWLFEQKRAWLERKGIGESTVTTDAGLAHALAVAGSPGVGVLAVTAGDVLVAAMMCVEGEDAIQAVVTAYDPAYEDCSPGSLIIEACGQIAAARGLNLDLRTGKEAYKLRWADCAERYETFAISCSTRGHVALVIHGLGMIQRRLLRGLAR